ncbi:hypothetical protein Clacol_009799 [Clathrus columnatus]|uniref:Uncharacterized protein n=1 Tax=Clathrus columnatus TaxID=1419009 RepID=A0AAV5ARU3_9AGAM|nr:hypothetical protein Clacol_009799 [Clathrus columnatus]
MSMEGNYSTGGGASIAPSGRMYAPTGMSPANTPNPYEHRQRADSTTSSGYNYNAPRFSQSSAELLTREVNDQEYQHQYQQQYPQSLHRAMTPGSTGAGYNPSSFVQPGREAPVKGLQDDQTPLNSAEAKDFNPHEEGWDVYADFNNAGPRYSTMAPLAGTPDASNDYRKLPTQPSGLVSPSDLKNGPVELVTVPALGAEWGKDELHAMTKTGKREVKREKWATRWRSLRREENGFLGTHLSRRNFVFVLFGICCVIGVILAFTIPRVPGILINASAPLSGGSNIVFSRAPTNFTFDVDLNLQLDTHSTFVPITLSSFDAILFDLNSNLQIATGNVHGKTFPAGKFIDYSFPITFNYTAVNQSDPTWNDVYNACRNPATEPGGGPRPPIAFRVELFMSIIGLVKTQGTGLTVTSASCPFELPVNSVMGTDLAKNSADLLGRDYPVAGAHIDIKTKILNGVTFKCLDYLENYGINGLKLEAATSLQADKMTKGAVFSATYKQPGVHSRISLDALNVPICAVETAFGLRSGFVLGSEAVYNMGEGKILRYGLGACFSAPSYAATILALNNCKTFIVSYYHRVSSDVEAGARATYYNMSPSAVNLEVGAKAYLNSAAFIKSKINSNGIASLAYHQTMSFVFQLALGCATDTQKLGDAVPRPTMGVGLSFESSGGASAPNTDTFISMLAREVTRR